MNENFEPEFTDNNPDATQAPPVQPIAPKEENVLAGIVGALLFSLAGGIVWFLLYQIGFLAAISGIIGVVCAIKGYAIFGKRESVKGVIISTVLAFLVIVAAWYLCLSYDVYNAYQDWFANGEVDFTLTFAESVRAGYLFLVEDTEIAIAYLKDLGIGLIFCVVGAFGYVKAAIGKAKNN
ncbi:MAG: hypothetical protein J6R45_01845 [Clostridia bacterium]|nr:hypothetical protein [Clostridia bacterium]MBO5786043.1 hypothetical protein [Clostridia bacterium]